MHLSDNIRIISEAIDEHLEKGELVNAISAIDAVITNKSNIEQEFLSYAKVEFAAIYIEVADSFVKQRINLDDADKLLKKACGIFNQLIDFVPEMSLFIKCNRAKSLMIRHDIQYLKNQATTGNTQLTFDEVESIYLIKDNIADSIRLYWEALKECPDEEEKYNIRNNLGNGLSRMGRSLEAQSLYDQNVIAFPKRWQSHISLVHSLGNLVESALIPETPSLHFVALESYNRALNCSVPENVKSHVDNRMAFHIKTLAAHGQLVSDEILALNRKEEKEDYENHSEYRKFVLNNDLSLSEHSLYCKCRDSRIDNLKIGVPGGSVHLGKPEIFPILDGLVNRLISEFSFSRLLFFHYASGISLTADDIEFSNLTNNDLTGYHIEQLRTSYRIAYGILDKIKNGIAMLYETDKTKLSSTYFEDYFDKSKDELKDIKNRHLTALYSLALDLNRDTGSFKHFKEFRNELEHGFLAVSAGENHPHLLSLTEEEIKQLTLDLLKLTRSAIFSFVFLVRTTTISSIS